MNTHDINKVDCAHVRILQDHCQKLDDTGSAESLQLPLNQSDTAGDSRGARDVSNLLPFFLNQ